MNYIVAQYNKNCLIFLLKATLLLEKHYSYSRDAHVYTGLFIASIDKTWFGQFVIVAPTERR